MNYTKIYNQIIEHRIHNSITGYTEKHHIIPKSLTGTDDDNNLVNLTAREHFLCHYLLAKMYPEKSGNWYKMQYAFTMMKCMSYSQNRYFNSRLYCALKQNRSIAMRQFTGKNNSQYGKMWISNVIDKQTKTIPKTDAIPEGWIKGRNAWNRKKKITQAEKNKLSSERMLANNPNDMPGVRDKISKKKKGTKVHNTGKRCCYDIVTRKRIYLSL